MLLVKGFSKNESKINLKAGNSAYILNAQELGTVVPGRLSNLMLHTIVGCMILWSRIGNVVDFIFITLEEYNWSN